MVQILVEMLSFFSSFLSFHILSYPHFLFDIKMLFASLATLVLAAMPSVSAAPSKKCTKPAVRKEWRSLSKQTRAEYLAAVNVCPSIPASSTFINHHPLMSFAVCHQASSQPCPQTHVQYQCAYPRDQPQLVSLRWYAILSQFYFGDL